MCGFVVIKKNKFFKKKKIINSSKLLEHRGPDDCSFYEDNDIFMIFYRLSIQDTSILGRQPMVSKSKKNIMVFNGEIYNALELRKLVNKKNLIGKSDSEILIELYEKKGPSILKKINGMFSVVIYNFKSKKFFTFRDRFGIKPLYYYNKDFLMFSSEIKPILKYVGKNFFNKNAIGDFLFRGFMDHDEKTFFQNIYSHSTAKYKIFKGKKILQSTSYWNLDYKPKKLKNIKSKLKKLWGNSVKQHLISDVKLGAFLSGGSDSTHICQEMKKHVKYQLESFTYNFKDKSKKNFGELSFAKKISNNLKLKNYYSSITPEYIKKNIDNLVLDIESPFTSIRLFGVKKLYQLVKKNGLKVILEGYGGDEMLAGYEYNNLSKILDDNKKINKSNMIYKIFSKANINRFGIKKIINFIYALNSQGNFTSDGTPYLYFDLFNSRFFNKYCKQSNIKLKLRNNNFLQRSQLFDIKFIHIPRTLKYVDRLSMKSGVEARVPYLDHELFNFCFSLSNDQKIYKNVQRRIWKNTFINKDVSLNKRSIVDPQREWFKTFLKKMLINEVNSQNKIIKIFFNKKNLVNYVKNYNNSKTQTSFNLFQILTLIKFIKVFNKKFNVFL